MAEIIVTSYFETNSGPTTGLSPTIRIWEAAAAGDVLVVGFPCGTGLAVDGTMLEMGDCGSPATTVDGFYRFTFTEALGYDPTKTYVVRVDAVTLPVQFRYQTTSITPVDSTQGIADSVWNADAAIYPSSSPETMGGRHNATYESVETIRVTDIPALFMLMDLVRKYNTNRTKIDAATYTLTLYDDDCVTPLRIFRLLDSTGTPSVEEAVCERVAIDGTVDVSSPSGYTGDDGYPTCSNAAP